MLHNQIIIIILIIKIIIILIIIIIIIIITRATFKYQVGIWQGIVVSRGQEEL